ncbi:MAG: gamma-glutamyl-gamma-aminobutyrate hydrolase family protein [Ignavibacteriae bacterium]|nr:gamma-glutamyl-gamma-aminobutyrate hydrolase family protein [Ignavibacteriota bacterium]
MKVVLTDPMTSAFKFGKYTSWITEGIPGVDLQVVSYKNTTGDPLDGCQGVILSGGVDVGPDLYGFVDTDGVVEETDPRRDAFEVGVIRAAIARDLPILGICRGTQLTNVVLGGTLVPDLQRAGHQDHRSTPEGDRVHQVAVEQGSLLAGITGVAQGTVSSAHHQAVGRVGEGLRVTARSADGVIEALEWAVPAGRAFFQLVQWHPERMTERENPLQRHLILQFAKTVNRHNT